MMKKLTSFLKSTKTRYSLTDSLEKIGFGDTGERPQNFRLAETWRVFNIIMYDREIRQILKKG